jgi:hypothetical protein
MYKCFITPGNKTAVRVDVIGKAGLNRLLLLRIWRDSWKQVCGYYVEISIWNENNYITLHTWRDTTAYSSRLAERLCYVTLTIMPSTPEPNISCSWCRLYSNVHVFTSMSPCKAQYVTIQRLLWHRLQNIVLFAAAVFPVDVVVSSCLLVTRVRRWQTFTCHQIQSLSSTP